MQLELGAEVDQSLVAERLQGAVSYHGTQQLEVSHKDVQCGEVDVNVLPPLKVFFIPVDSVDSLLYLTDVAQIWLEVAVPVIAGGFWGVAWWSSRDTELPPPPLLSLGLLSSVLDLFRKCSQSAEKFCREYFMYRLLNNIASWSSLDLDCNSSAL